MALLSRAILALCFAFSSSSVLAQTQCDVELSHGLIITDDVIRILDKGQTRVQIKNNNQHTNKPTQVCSQVIERKKFSFITNP